MAEQDRWSTKPNLLTIIFGISSMIFGIASTIGVLYAVGLLKPFAPDPHSPEGARLELEHRQLPFTGQGFLHAVVEDTPEVTELYLRAGSNPNTYLSGVPFFPVYMAMQNSGNELKIINMLVHFGAKLSLLNEAHQMFPYPHMTMGQEAFFEAVRRGRSDIARHLIELGVNPDFFVGNAKYIVCDQTGFGAGQVTTMQEAGVNIHACGK